MRYRLRTLLILLAIGPPLVASCIGLASLGQLTAQSRIEANAFEETALQAI
jgi:hypothetical protein